MVDWLSSMQQTYEYYVVDPGTWKDVELLDNVKTSSINRDEDTDTLGSASIDVTNSVGECYIRIYLITIQNGVREKHALGTFLVQTPSSSFNGRIRNVTMDAYTPLLELKEKPMPIGYSIEKGTNIMKQAYMLVRENVRAPVVEPKCDKTLPTDFVADVDETCLNYNKSLIANAKYKFALDAMGRVLFAPIQDTASLQPVWTYNDDNSSILYPEISMNHDLYNIPNVIEVIYSNGSVSGYAKVVNNDPNSPTSIQARGREIGQIITNPGISGFVGEEQLNIQLKEYATAVLREASTVEYTITYTHGYCPVTLGDCVRLNYSRAGIADIKAKVISQTIKCEPGCPVTEKAVFTTKLWG